MNDPAVARLAPQPEEETPAPEKAPLPLRVRLADFYAYMPEHKYIFAPTGDMWPAASVNARLPMVPVLKKDGTVVEDEDGKPIRLKPSTWLDKYRAVEAMTWAPGEGELIIGKLPGKSGWTERSDVMTFNLYQPPPAPTGNAAGASRWIELVEKVYPNDAGHIIAYSAHRVQRPAEKINHGVLLAGHPGIGKDTILEPLRLGVGAANFTEASPHDVMSPYNDFMRGVVLRISEARDQGEINRYTLYEKTKTMLAAPPDMTRVNSKYIPQYYAVNVAGVFITTNHSFDGLYLPPDDRRHYVAATEITPVDFEDGFWPALWGWYGSGGLEDVVAYLAAYDLSKFDPKAPPKKTEAFWQMVGAGTASEVPELNDALDRLGRPAVVTLAMVQQKAVGELQVWLSDRKNRRTIPHRFSSCGYLPTPNEARDDKLWTINSVRQVVYGRRDMKPAERITAAETLKAEEDRKAAEWAEKFRTIKAEEEAKRRK